MNYSSHLPRPVKVDLRTIWISDLHIGTRESKIKLLVDFLERNPCKTLYLVGDVVDLRVISRRQRWLRQQEEALIKLLDLLTTTQIVVLPGNHDRILRSLPALHGYNIALCQEHVHTTAKGLQLLVTHGDLMDGDIRTEIAEWKVDLACCFYYAALRAEHCLNILRLNRGQALTHLISKTKASMSWWRAYRDRFENAIVEFARSRGYDGVVCGHIHAPRLNWHGPVLYANTGDWVENCTAIVETDAGDLHLARWDRFGLHPIVQRVASVGVMQS